MEDLVHVVDVAGVLQRRPDLGLGPDGDLGVAHQRQPDDRVGPDPVRQVGDADVEASYPHSSQGRLQDPGPVLGVGRHRPGAGQGAGQGGRHGRHPLRSTRELTRSRGRVEACRSVPPPRRTSSTSRRSTTTTPGRRCPRSTTSRPARSDGLSTVGDAARPGEHLLVVVAEDGEVRGYAESSVFRDRPAYERTREVSVYLGLDAQQQGFGRRLYDELLGLLRADGIHVALAVIALPNPASEAAPPVVRLHPRRRGRGGRLEVRRLGGHRLVAAAPGRGDAGLDEYPDIRVLLQLSGVATPDKCRKSLTSDGFGGRPER